jgi:Ankyrin repeats (3 copies)
MSNRLLVIVSVVFVALIVAAGVGRIAWVNYQQRVTDDPQTHFVTAAEAIDLNDPTRLSVLLAQYPGLASVHADADGTTLLHKAMNNGGDLDCSSMLVADGADVNAVDLTGRTPLHELYTYTAGLISPDVVKLLVTNGADMNPVDHAGVRPLDQMVADSDMYAEVFPDYFTNPTTQNRDLLKQHGAVE